MCILASAQAPGSFSYQAVLRNSAGEPLTNADVIFLFSIIKTNALGTVVYTEKHTVETNEFGLVNLAVGSGTDKTGDFAAIDWGVDNYFLNVQVDKGDAVFTDMGSTQLLSVPYAFNAATVQTISGGFYYRDKDGDGFGYMYESVWVPDGTAPPAYYVNNSSDCNDNDFYTQDGSPEICDGIDNDCNGLVDEFWPELGDICYTGEGVCRSYGFVICDPGNPAGPPICNAVPGIPSGPETCNYMDDDCDGEVDNGFCDENGKYYTDNACGNCYTDCQAIFNLPNAYGQCDNSGPAPVCIMMCNPGYYDLDQIPQNGCEFQLLEDAVYVSASGTDAAGCGTGFKESGGLNTCRTINHGIGEAISQTKRKVLVANGIYNETVNMADGIDLLGGYDPVTWARNPDNSSTIISGTKNIDYHLAAVTANNITAATTFSGFIIQGAVNNNPSGNFYAIYVSSSDENLRITDNSVYGGNAGHGNGGVDGAGGPDGLPGGTGMPTVETTSYNAVFSVSGGNGGGGEVSGGDGGGVYGTLGGIVQQESGEAGSSSGALPGGSGGEGGYNRTSSDCGTFSTGGYSAQGLPGLPGLSGNDGSGGTGGTNVTGTVTGSHWAGQNGLDGIKGSNGSGGGGGGSGGGADVTVNCSPTDDCSGGTGGGGGGGGAGGNGGTGGKYGGASFCIFIINSSSPVIENNKFYLGSGGNGGDGGFGGVKGTGGTGGPGGQISGPWAFVLGLGGDGGKGGDGGHGGGGGGGAGGSSFGIYTFNTTVASDYLNNNVFNGGKAGIGGSGGNSYGNAGQKGSDGVVHNCRYQ